MTMPKNAKPLALNYWGIAGKSWGVSDSECLVAVTILEIENLLLVIVVGVLEITMHSYSQDSRILHPFFINLSIFLTNLPSFFPPQTRFHTSPLVLRWVPGPRWCPLSCFRPAGWPTNIGPRPTSSHCPCAPAACRSTCARGGHYICCVFN